MKIVRVTSAVVVQFPGTERMVALKPDEAYDEAHPLVKAYPWAFESDSEIEQATAEPGKKGRRRAVKTEQVTAAPGETR
jgi:hypothetical protein